MKFKNSKLVIRISALLISFVVFSVSVFPTQATKDVEELENATSNMESNVSSLNKELDGIVKQIKKTANHLEQTKEELAIAKGEEDAQYESMMLRIKYMYENGNEVDYQYKGFAIQEPAVIAQVIDTIDDAIFCIMV